MLVSRVDYGPPPMPWGDVTSGTSQDLLVKQWVHYIALFRDLGYRMFPLQADENGQLLPLPGPDLPPPVDAFNPRDEENYVHIPVAYAWNHQPIYHGIQFMLDDSRREVIVKVIRTASERDLVEYLADQRREKPDPRDHTIPFLRMIDTGHCTFLVMPCWAEDATPFYAMGEPVEMLKQCLEGVAYLHEHRIAHRDISSNNIVMNYQGCITGDEDNWVLPFRSLFDVRYGFIDFNCSTRFSSDEPLESIRTVGHIFTPPYDAPELSETVPYNPFAVDVYALGAVMKDSLASSTTFRSHVVELLQKHLPEFFDLLNSMMDRDPEARPTAAAAYERICALQSQTDPEILALHGQPEDAVPGDGTRETIATAQPQKDPATGILKLGGQPEGAAHKEKDAVKTPCVQPESDSSNVVP